jgi:hypothetical protein
LLNACSLFSSALSLLKQPSITTLFVWAVTPCRLVGTY